MINGDMDRVVPSNSVADLTTKLKTQRGIKIEHEVVPGANHFFEGKMDELNARVGTYLDMRMAAKETESKEKAKVVAAPEPVEEDAELEEDED